MGFFRRYPLFIAIVLILLIIQLVPLNNQNKIKESRFARVVLLITFYPQKTVNFLSNMIVNNWYKYINNINTYEKNNPEVAFFSKDVSKINGKEILDCIDRNTLQAYETGYGDAGTDVILFKCQCGAEFGVLKTTFETAQ